MKNNFALLLISILIFTACSEDIDDNLVLKTEVQTNFNFSNNWDETPIDTSDIETTIYKNANGSDITITRLRYVISEVTFTTQSGENITIEGHKLIDVTNGDLKYTPEMKIPVGIYDNVSFTYGLKHEYNIDNAYADLNSASFNVGPMLGGGYHYMQLDGKYSNNMTTDAAFNYHHIRAANMAMGEMPSTFADQDTYITVNLGAMVIENDIDIEVKANIAEWFKTPNTWDLNTLNTKLMPNINAQLLMTQNGKNVFSKGEVKQ